MAFFEKSRKGANDLSRGSWTGNRIRKVTMNGHSSAIEGARFRDTSQQIHKQWNANPSRAFPTVGNARNFGNSSFPVEVLNSENTSTPNTTPSSSPTNNKPVTHNGSYETQQHDGNTSSSSKQYKVQMAPTTTKAIHQTIHDRANSVIRNSLKGGRVTEVMELCYVTERIIALWYKEDAQEVLKHATSLLRGKHANNYLIFNLSSSERLGEPNTREAGWPQELAPSLEKLCALCKELDSWLNSASNRVVVLHAKGSKERLGVAVAAYMNYSSICGGRNQALDRFAMRRFLDDKIGPLSVPSHRRYIEYFTGLLSGSLHINPTPLYLTHLTVFGFPLSEPTGCRAFLKVYEGLTPVYTTDLYSVPNTQEFSVNVGRLRLRGDILIKCYNRVFSKQSREVMFSLQFHTCVITENVVSFPRSELDVACKDPRCPTDSVVTLYFATDKLQDTPLPAPAPAPTVPHTSPHYDPILHWDSYTNLEMSDDEDREIPLSSPPPSNFSAQTTSHLGYTCGPVDGSLYAVVHPGTGGEGRGSPLTVSMDSGISSAAPQRPSPPGPETGNQAHGDLDKLLHDMMLTVESLPAAPSENYNRTSRNDKMYLPESRNYSSQASSHPSTSNYSTLKDSYRSYSGNKESSPPYDSSSNTLKNEYGESTLRKQIVDRRDDFRALDLVDFRDKSPENSQAFSPPGHFDFIEDDIPYHARQTSQPFSYGATTDMIKHQKLSSPASARKATIKGTTPVPTDDILDERSQEFSNNRLKHFDSSSWLRQQQLKLAARRDEKNPAKLWRQESGNRMLGELRNVQRSRMRNDGYASDSAILDDEDEIWTTSPIYGQPSNRAGLHSSAPASPLLPHRSISRKLNGSIANTLVGRPRAESVNERPFVSVKRAYEARKYESQPNDFPRSISPGTISRPQTPAFPVYPRTPYVNNSPTVTFATDRVNNINNGGNNNVINHYNETSIKSVDNNNSSYGIDRIVFADERREVLRDAGLPPKSPTTQRFESAILDSSYFSKDRPASPVNESMMSQVHVISRNPGTPSYIEYTHNSKGAILDTSTHSGGHSSPQFQYYTSRRSSVHSNTEPHEVADANVKFVRDTSKIWYKPNISREQAIAMLREAVPGTFVVRDSNSFPGAFGLALKVAIPPLGVTSSPKDPSTELVRHFLIEPTSRGVRLKGCANEPVFSSLSALVYQHSLIAMALPCLLLLPEPEAAAKALDSTGSKNRQLLAQGAACNVLYLFTMDTESLTGPQAIKKTISVLFQQKPPPVATVVHFKVSTQGITLTDNARKLFFRRHYPTSNISFCGLDFEEKCWKFVSEDTGKSLSAHRCFGFVARKPANKSDNQCHIFAELEPEQPATAIVNFVNKVMMGNENFKANIV